MLTSDMGQPILIVEDETSLREGLVDLLEGEGYLVHSAADGETGLAKAIELPVEAVLLDVMMPKLDGIQVCRRLRQHKPGIPVLMLTAKGAEDDKVSGLKSGADDYVTKPFSPRELLARLEALLRRSQPQTAQVSHIESRVGRFDLGKCQLLREDKNIRLTPREVGIVRWLHQHRDRAVTRAELLQQVWQAPSSLETRTVDMAIANLRRKIESNPSEPVLIQSVKGVGYTWNDAS